MVRRTDEHDKARGVPKAIMVGGIAEVGENLHCVPKVEHHAGEDESWKSEGIR